MNLGFTNDVVFGETLRRYPECCRRLIEVILGIKVREIRYLEKQKTLDFIPGEKGVRLDVYVEDDENTVYDIEMQTTKDLDLPKRSRYYQSLVDMEHLIKGASYRKLNKSFVIFICTTDPFGRGLGRYWFMKTCRDHPEIELEDDANLVILFAGGETKDLSAELANFLSFVSNDLATDDFTEDLWHNVEEVTQDPEVRRQIMTLEQKFEDIRYEATLKGRAEGMAEGMAEGRAEGKAEGKAEVTMELLRDGSITPGKAAALLGITEEEVRKMFEGK